MAEELAIARPQTTEEKKNFVELKENRKLSYKETKLRRIREVESDMHSQLKPYDRYSAIIDLQKAIDEYVVEYKARLNADVKDFEGSLSKEDIFPESKIQSYGDAKRFKIVSVKDIINQRIVDGVKQSVQDMKTVEFVAIRGNKIALQITNKQYEEKFAPKKEPAKV